MESALDEFLALVMRNLNKNGFPEKQVSLPLETMYGEADKRGFSFNKVRDILSERGVISELTDTRVVFSAADVKGVNEEEDLFQAAKNLLGRMSQEEKKRWMEMAQNMDPSTLQTMKQQWESMNPQQKAEMLAQLKNR